MASDLHWVARIVADYRTGADGRVVADLDVFAENRAGSDGYVLSDLGGSGNDGGGMNFAIAVGVAEQLRGSGEGETGLGGNQNRLGGFVAPGEVSGDYRGRGIAVWRISGAAVVHTDPCNTVS